MKELKLRVWIPDIKRMYQVCSIELNPHDGHSKTAVLWEHPSEKAAKIKNKTAKFNLSDKTPVISFTGKADKHGNDIYEDHIIKAKFTAPDETYPAIGIVYFDEESLGY